MPPVPFCPQCGAVALSGAKFCGSCGQPLAPPSFPPAAPPAAAYPAAAIPAAAYPAAATPAATPPGAAFPAATAAPSQAWQPAAPAGPAAAAFHAPPPGDLYSTPGAAGKPSQGVAIVGLVLNIIVWPGLGSLIASRAVGWAQGFLFLLGLALTLTLIGAILGIPLMLAMWIWGIVTGAQLLKASG